MADNCTFTASRGDLFHFAHNGVGGGADLIFTGNHLSNNYIRIATGGGGMTVGSNGTSNMTYNISTNTFRDAVGAALLIVESTTTDGISMVGTVNGNSIGVTGVSNSGSLEGDGIKAQFVGKLGAGGTGVFKATISNNIIQQYNNLGMNLVTGGGAGASSGTYEAIVTGNTVGPIGSNTSAAQGQGIAMNGGTTPGDTFNIYLELGGTGADANSVNNFTVANGLQDIRLRQRQLTTIHLTGKNGAGTTSYGGANNDNAAVVTFFLTNNTTTGAANNSATNTVPTGGGFVGGAPPLLFALGGVERLSNDLSARSRMRSSQTGETLAQEELNTLVSAAIQRWSATGLTEAQLAALRGIKFEVTDLSGDDLGRADGNRILVSRTARGKGWFIDPNPMFDASFANPISVTLLYTDPLDAAAGHVDLLTAIEHEMGHRLGLDDLYAERDCDSIMYGYLTVGERRLPAPGQAGGARPGGLNGAHRLSLRSPSSIKARRVATRVVPLSGEAVDGPIGTSTTTLPVQ